MFNKEADFENALVPCLHQKLGKGSVALSHRRRVNCQLAAHLNKTNQHIDKLDVPLIRSEMNQILEQVRALKTPYALNGFINGKTVAIKRENEGKPSFRQGSVAGHF